MSYQQRLQEIRQRFLTGIPDRLSAIEALMEDAVKATPPAREDAVATELHRRCHDLAGSSSMLGAKELGRAAHELMNASRAASIAGRPLAAHEAEAFAAGMVKLRAAAAILRASARADAS